jgi:hypothetical protein
MVAGKRKSPAETLVAVENQMETVVVWKHHWMKMKIRSLRSMSAWCLSSLQS